MTSTLTKPKEWKREAVLSGETKHIETPCGDLSVVLNRQDGRLVEVFSAIGKPGNCVRTCLQTMSILISVLLQSGMDKSKLIKTIDHLADTGCGNRIYHKGNEYRSCPDVISKLILEELKK